MPELSELPILPALSSPAQDDVAAVYDVSERNGTRKITLANLLTALKPSGTLTSATMADDDELLVWDTSAGVFKTITVAQLRTDINV